MGGGDREIEAAEQSALAVHGAPLGQYSVAVLGSSAAHWRLTVAVELGVQVADAAALMVPLPIDHS
jgi:hypothetical protein